jgi:plasmid stabilization system protein ParE
LKVELSKRAQRAVRRIDAHWRTHADHPELFFEELLEVVEHLETVSNAGTPCPTSRRPQLKRMLLEKTKCHLYFVSDERKQRIDVLHVWDGRRERLPML